MRFPVEVFYPTDAKSLLTLVRKLSRNRVSVTERARDLFVRRGCIQGHELDDWFTAEHELYNVPQADMKETANSIQIQVAVPGIEPKSLRVIALPGYLIVDGSPRMATETEGEVTVFSELSPRPLFRCFTIRQPIQPDSVTAAVEDGLLMVCALKAKVMTEAERLEIEAKRLVPVQREVGAQAAS